MVGCSEGELSRGLSELSAAGVYSVTKAGVIFSRRMVRDENLSKIRQKAGKMGGNPAFKKGESNPYYKISKISKPDNQKITTPHNQKITPSSSSSIKENNKKKSSLPEGFEISERVRLWANKNGHDNLKEHLEAFKRKCRAHGYKYLNWDDAFMEAVRENWAKVGNGNGYKPPSKQERLPTQEEELAAFNERWDREHRGADP
jgi:hypothetical protein